MHVYPFFPLLHFSLCTLLLFLFSVAIPPPSPTIIILCICLIYISLHINVSDLLGCPQLPLYNKKLLVLIQGQIYCSLRSSNPPPQSPPLRYIFSSAYYLIFFPFPYLNLHIAILDNSTDQVFCTLQQQFIPFKPELCFQPLAESGGGDNGKIHHFP